MTRIFSGVKSHKLLLSLIILVIVNLPLQNSYKRYISGCLTNLDSLRIEVLIPDSSIKVTPQVVQQHNDKLRELLSQKINNEYSSAISRESSHQQTRGFYVLIVVGLLSIILTRSDGKPLKRTLKWILLILIAIMYLLEVHELDLNTRYRTAAMIYNKEIDSLTNYEMNFTTWHKFDNKKLYDWMKNESNLPKLWIRKLIKAVILYDFGQLILYIIPIILVLFWIRTDQK